MKRGNLPGTSWVNKAVIADWKTNPCVLAVGDTTLGDRVGEAVVGYTEGGSVQTVRGWLMALGQVATEAPAAVVGRVEDLDEPYSVMAGALRKLAPATRLFLICDADHQGSAARAVGAGFDRYWVEPVDWEDLIRAVLEDPACQTAGAAEDMMGPTVATLVGPALPPRGERPVGPERGVGLRPPDSGTRRAPSTAALVRGHFEGEIDLVEMLLLERRGFCDAAIQMVAKLGGIDGVKWAKRLGDIPTDHACAPIRYLEQDLGVLHAPPPVVTERLSVWSDWIARWLALEQHLDRLWHMALRDELTGLWNRRYFNQFLNSVLERAARDRFRVTLLIFDIDDFKAYNDRYGHAAGDEILREAARLMQSVVRDHDVVARIGGDEFAVIFWDATAPRREHSEHPQDALEAAARFQQAIHSHRFPKLGDQAHDRLTISGGLATFPWDGRTADELVNLADRMAMQSKRQGKNAITIGPGSKRKPNRP